MKLGRHVEFLTHGAVDEYARAGIPFEPHTTRFERLKESVHLLKGLFGESRHNHACKHYRIDGMDGRPKLVQKPHPRFLIGGGGRRVLELAALEAQIVGLALRIGTPGRADIRSVLAETTDKRVAWIKQSGRRPLRRAGAQDPSGVAADAGDGRTAAGAAGAGRAPARHLWSGVE
jgi:alkanesulfonate monooxygenase SsuD/methylene tetrahydromethanopterin reductase-like flavin-dependent oxidoreductase (luciferase family)